LFAARHRLIQYSLRVDLITLSVFGISGGVSCFKQAVDFHKSLKNLIFVRKPYIDPDCT